MTSTVEPEHDLDLGEAEASTELDERISLWRLTDPAVEPRGVALVAPGFGRSMLDMSPIALYLARNGLTVHRYEGRGDHGPLGSREDPAFTMGKGLARMRAALAHARRVDPGLPVALVGASLAARAAYRLAATSEAAEAVVTLVGVVNLRDTLRRVLGTDYHDHDPADLPETVVVERVRMELLPFWRDVHLDDWGGLASTVAELTRARGPVANFFSRDDEWVDADDVVTAFGAPGLGSRRVIELGTRHHDVGRNQVVLQETLTRLTEVTLEGLDRREENEPTVVPAFHEVVGQRIRERRLRRQRRGAGAGASSVAAG